MKPSSCCTDDKSDMGTIKGAKRNLTETTTTATSCEQYIAIDSLWHLNGNMSRAPDGTLNHVEHTLPCSKFLRAHVLCMHRRQDNSNSQAEECKGHTLNYLREFGSELGTTCIKYTCTCIIIFPNIEIKLLGQCIA